MIRAQIEEKITILEFSKEELVDLFCGRLTLQHVKDIRFTVEQNKSVQVVITSLQQVHGLDKIRRPSLYDVTGPVIFDSAEQGGIWSIIRSKILKYMPQVLDERNR